MLTPCQVLHDVLGPSALCRFPRHGPATGRAPIRMDYMGRVCTRIVSLRGIYYTDVSLQILHHGLFCYRVVPCLDPHPVQRCGTHQEDSYIVFHLRRILCWQHGWLPDFQSQRRGKSSERIPRVRACALTRRSPDTSPVPSRAAFVSASSFSSL